MKRKFTLLTVLTLTAAMALSMTGCAVYWAEREGKAELARARYAKQIIEIEAEQRMIAETFHAEAEVIRANGIAESMAIINQAITPEYLKHFWIRTLANHHNVIYVSIESGFPVYLNQLNPQINSEDE